MRGQYIDFISSYCDNWCERCPLTERCSAFAVHTALEMCEGNISDAIELAVGAPPPRTAAEARRRAKFAEEIESIPEPTEQERQAFQREEDERDERIEETALTTASERVALLSDHWLDRYAAGFSTNVAPGLAEAIETAEHDRFFIPAKLHRAQHGLDEARQSGRRRRSIQTDWNGSAKIALISIVRSTAAWDLIAETTGDPDAAHVARELRTLQREVEAVFPKAWQFQRPGFDDDGRRRRRWSL